MGALATCTDRRGVNVEGAHQVISLREIAIDIELVAIGEVKRTIALLFNDYRATGCPIVVDTGTHSYGDTTRGGRVRLLWLFRNSVVGSLTCAGSICCKECYHYRQRTQYRLQLFHLRCPPRHSLLPYHCYH